MCAVVVLLMISTTTPGVMLAVPEIERAPAMPRNEVSLPAATRTDCVLAAPVFGGLLTVAPAPMYALVWLVSTATEPLRLTATVPEAPPSTPTPWSASALTAVTASPLTVWLSGVAIRFSPSLGLVRLLPEPVRLALIGLGCATPVFKQ